MQRDLWMKNWPAGMARTVSFKRGEIPLFEYLRADAREHPDKAAIVYYGRTVTYRELDESSDRVAHALSRMGIRKGDRVALFLENCPQYVIAHYGIQKAGAVVVPCSPMFKEWELEHELADSGAEILICLDHLYPVAEAVRGRTNVRKIVVTSFRDYLPPQPSLPLHPSMEGEKKSFAGTVDWLRLLADHEARAPMVEIDLKEDLALLQYTAGTTGLPKGAMLTHYNALFKTAAGGQVVDLILDGNLRALTVMPIFHIAGMLAGVNLPVYVGGTAVMLSRFTVESFVKAVDLYKCNVAYVAVPMAVAVLQYPELRRYDLSSLSAFPYTLSTSFGIALTDEISEAWKKVAGSALAETSYGLTETHTADTIKLPGAPGHPRGGSTQ
jgi:long-chain acyl-CoA synthetase